MFWLLLDKEESDGSSQDDLATSYHVVDNMKLVLAHKQSRFI